MAKTKSRFIRLLFIGLLIFGVFSLFTISCETETAIVNLAIKKDGKTYVYSKLGEFFVENSIKKNESPSVMAFCKVFNDEGLYTSPENLEDIANLLGGNYRIFPFPEASYDGYITATQNSLYTRTSKNQSTAKVGEQIRVTTVDLRNPKNNKIYSIQWEWNPSDKKNIALNNCEIKTFWIKRKIDSGETVTSSEDFVMVNLNDIVKFYNDQLQLEFNPDEKLIYIIEN